MLAHNNDIGDGRTPKKNMSGGNVMDQSYGEKRRKTTRDADDTPDSLEEIIDRLSSHKGDICIRFSSAEGGHYVRFVPREGLKAVYSGPNGPENRPAHINQENIGRLLSMSDYHEYKDLQNSPYTDLAVRSEQ